ncbi:ATP-binding protein [Archangium lansingense]|uniref:sensor histidine kinase n=1 Tax=Archangium lansingense TaxID=2995310 RepID=UPI003B7EF900
MNGALMEPAPRFDLESLQLEVLWNAPIGIALVDRELQVVRFNRALAELHCLRARIWSGIPLADVLPPGEATQDVLWRSQQVLATGQPFTWHELEWGRVSCHPLHDGAEVVGLCLYLEELFEPGLAREAVRESEARLGGIMAALSEGIVVQDPSGAIEFSNAAASRLLGLTQDQLQGRTSTDPRWRAVKEDGSPYPGEEHPAMLALRTGVSQLDKVMGVVRPDGTRVWLSINALLLSVPDGDGPLGVVSSFFDITQRKEAEEALRIGEERLRLSLASAAIGTWDYNPATHQFLCDDRTEELFGVPPGQVMDCELFFSVIHPEDRERTRQVIERTLSPESGGCFGIEYRVIGVRGGVERWLFSQGRAWFDDQGQLVRFNGTVLDITHRKRAEASARFLSEASRLLADRLDRAEDILQQVARLSASSICSYCIIGVTQPDGALPRVAGAHREPSREPLVQAVLRFMPKLPGTSPLLEGIHTGKSALFRDFNQATRQRFAVSPEHLELMNTLDAHSVMTVPMRAGGKVHGIMILAAAGSQRRFDEEDLALAEELAHRVGMSLENLRLYEEARQAVGLRDEFLSVASHELKTPLTSLKLQHTLIDKYLTPECRESVGARLPKAVRQVDRLSSLVDSLLDVSRIGAGRLGLEPVEMEFTHLLREVMERLSEVFAQAGCEVDFPVTPLVRGYWDPLRLDQVFVNLLSNAAKYGAGKPIRVCVAVEGEWVRLTIQDEGIGISPEDVPRLFSRFGRAVSERHYGGLGLGLFISKQIVEAMEGRIRVESEPARGATFIVELPLCTMRR